MTQIKPLNRIETVTANIDMTQTEPGYMKEFINENWTEKGTVNMTGKRIMNSTPDMVLDKTTSVLSNMTEDSWSEIDDMHVLDNSGFYEDDYYLSMNGTDGLTFEEYMNELAKLDMANRFGFGFLGGEDPWGINFKNLGKGINHAHEAVISYENFVITDNGNSTVNKSQNTTESKVLEPSQDATVDVTTDIAIDVTGLPAYMVWSIGSPIILTVGTVGNGLALLLLCKKSIRKTVTSLYLMTLACVDTVILYSGLLLLYVRVYVKFDVRLISAFACKFHMFFGYSILQYNHWLVVMVTVERLFAVFCPHKYRTIFTKQKAACGLCAQALIITLINSHLWFTYDLTSIPVNNRSSKICAPPTDAKWNFIYGVWPWIDFCISSLVPFFIILNGNIALVYGIVHARFIRRQIHQQGSSNQQQSSSQNQPSTPQQPSNGAVSTHHGRKLTSMTACLLAVSIVFFLTTAPISIYLIGTKTFHQNADEDDRKVYNLIWASLNMILYVNHATNFFLYIISGRRFRRELIKLWCQKNFATVHPVHAIPPVNVVQH